MCSDLLLSSGQVGQGVGGGVGAVGVRTVGHLVFVEGQDFERRACTENGLHCVESCDLLQFVDQLSDGGVLVAASPLRQNLGSKQNKQFVSQRQEVTFWTNSYRVGSISDFLTSVHFDAATKNSRFVHF